ncbi:hypothetical protein QUB70_22165 [Microcoleus sp. A003_D6]
MHRHHNFRSAARRSSGPKLRSRDAQLREYNWAVKQMSMKIHKYVKSERNESEAKQFACGQARLTFCYMKE